MPSLARPHSSGFWGYVGRLGLCVQFQRVMPAKPSEQSSLTVARRPATVGQKGRPPATGSNRGSTNRQRDPEVCKRTRRALTGYDVNR